METRIVFNDIEYTITQFEQPAGLLYIPDFISEKEASALIKKLDALHWTHVEMRGNIARRKVVHFGLKYVYHSRKANLTTPIPNYLRPYILRFAALTNSDPHLLKAVLINKYDIGAGIGWHRDAPFFGNKVFGINLVSETILKFRYEKNIKKLHLARNSAYVISGEARDKWEHSISPVKQFRYSITFRIVE